MNKIKYYRKQKGWSQTTLSKESNVSRTTISNLETGKQISVTIDTMKRIAKALDKTVSTIFFN